MGMCGLVLKCVRNKRRVPLAVFFLLLLSAFLVRPDPAWATYIEQMTISTRALTLGNAVTANPPGHMSIHYNPAGLSEFEEGNWWHQGVTVPQMKKKTTVRGNSDFEGWLQQESWDHFADPVYEDQPGRDEISADELKAEGTAESGVMYIPIYDRPINFQISPRTSLVHQPEDSRWTLATGMYTPYATGANHSGSGDPTQYGSKRAYQQHLIYQAPSASYQVTDELSLGVSVGVGQTAMGAETKARSPNDLTALTRELGEATEGMAIPPWTYLYYDEPLYGGGIHPWEAVAEIKLSLRDDFTPNYNLGLLYEPWDWLGLGLVYQSPIEAELSGDFKIEYSEDFQQMVHWYGQGPWGVRRTSAMLNMPTNPVPQQTGTVTHEVVFPRRVQGGIRISPVDRLDLMFDLKWSEWSMRDEDVYHFDQEIQMLQIAKLSGHTDGPKTLTTPRHFKDTLDWGVGAEIGLLDWLDLRLGYEYRESSVRKEYFDFNTPIPDMHLYGAGLGYHLDNGGRIDIGGAYFRGEDFEIGPEESHNLTSTDYFEHDSNMYAGQHVKSELEVYMFSIGFVVPFESYVGYQRDNIHSLKEWIQFFNPFSRSSSEG